MSGYLQRALDVIEKRELKLLVWGDTEIGFSRTELEYIIESILEKEDPSESEVIDELEEHAMLYETTDENEEGDPIYRSRMAESVRLYANLRQWFHGQSIEKSKTLVSDFRFMRKPRYYPARDQKLSKLLPIWLEQKLVNNLKQEALKALVGVFKMASFQRRATERILNATNRPADKAHQVSSTIICAGTGSGKTNAFYWPALSSIVDDVIKKPEGRVRVLAIYPRTELLKDQFNEAWLQCRELDGLMKKEGGRKLKIGALFAESFVNIKLAQYKAKIDNLSYHTFSLLKCNTTDCSGELRWNKAEFDKGIELLRCSLCANEVDSDEVALTRESMALSPPDILFTTTEMLNLRMGDPKLGVLFGIKAKQSVPLVLLDEVHTYSGTTGASVALLLRRWRFLSGGHSHFVGLSATLTGAEKFFAQLTGIKEGRTKLIEPSSEEMLEEGSEYMLALRGDAVSKTALLSTTIQAAILASRLQDKSTGSVPISNGTWGTKTFVFSDDLDATNRLFGNLSDAEGWKRRGGFWDRKDVGSLAMLRDPNTSDISQLNHYKQNWQIVKNIGFSLDSIDRTKIGRTSSDDRGVDPNAKVVIATAALEVGFNDPTVGTVIQHKAPQDFSSYLQRKGRAGRVREMRPWTIVTLSQFGRDRLIFQHYESLLDPEIKSLVLPVDNEHILRFHAAQATLDWAGRKVPKFNPWQHLNKPEKGFPTNVKKSILALFKAVLNGGQERMQLHKYIEGALALKWDDTGVVDKLLWKSPRSIYMEFLPTLIRKIETDWGKWSNDDQEIIPWLDADPRWGSPLEGFIPKNLYSDISTPELMICLERGGGVVDEKYMNFFAGLKTFAPGRISKRFSVKNENFSDWIFPVELEPSKELHNTSVFIEVSDVFGDNLESLEEVYCSELDTKIRVYRPTKIHTRSLPPQSKMTDKSNATLRWSSIFKPLNTLEALEIPAGSSWLQENLRSIAFCTHQTNTPLEVTRYSTGSNAELKFQGGKSASIAIDWQRDGVAVGIGTVLSVDALRIECHCSDERLRDLLTDSSINNALRYGYLQDLLAGSTLFDGNTFIADWIHECFITAIALEVQETNVTLMDAVERVCQKKSRHSLEDTRKFLFKEDTELQTQDGEESSEILKEQKLQEELKILLCAPSMLQELENLATQAFNFPNNTDHYLKWCRKVMGNTLACAVEQSICTVLPSVGDQNLNSDIVHSGDEIILWLSERDIGGVGIITQFEDRYDQDSLGLLNILASTLGVGDYEQLDADLTDLLEKRIDNPHIGNGLKTFREADDYKTRLDAVNKLKNALIVAGFEYSHSFTSVLFSRVLRPDSNEHTDKQLLERLRYWRSLESMLGIELPLNIISVVLAVNDKEPDHNVFSSACRIQSILWPRGHEVRNSVLTSYSYFNGKRRTERLLAAKLCPDRTPRVDYLGHSDWLQPVHVVLCQRGRVDLVLPTASCNKIGQITTEINATPIDIDGLLLYPRIIKIERELVSLRIRMELAEMKP